jgi:hypothetical protein
VNESLDVRLVPISAEQVRVLESVSRAFSGLASDFNRELGINRDESIAGGLHRIWSTLDVVATLWREQAVKDATEPERWRQALVSIATDAAIYDVRAIARRALDSHP